VAYQWANKVVKGIAPPDLPHPPAWITTDDSAALAVQVPSPVGAGDILVRTEFSATVGWNTGPTTDPPQPAGQLGFEFAGDVGDAAAAPPDALGSGVGRFALVASTDSFWTYNSPFGPGDSLYAIGTHTTRGYVTSLAKRGPDKYGAIHPYFNMGVNTVNGLSLVFAAGGFTVWYRFILRTLWKTP
jgi:hypothetical protein